MQYIYTFIYKVTHKTYYGKYCFDCISDDHEGLLIMKLKKCYIKVAVTVLGQDSG